EVRRHYGQPRRTVLAGAGAGPDVAQAPGTSRRDRAAAVEVVTVPADDVWVWLAGDGVGLVTPRGGRPPSRCPLRLERVRSLAAAVPGSSDQPVLVFSAGGQCYRATLSDQPVARSGAGRPMIALDAGDEVVAAFAGGQQEGEEEYYLLVTAGGQVKRLAATALATAHASGSVCCRVPEGDRIVAVVAHGPDDQILIGKAHGQVLRIETGAALRPVATPSAGTIAGVRVGAGDRVVSAAVAAGSSVLSVHRSGMALRAPLEDYPVKGRGTGGVQSVLTDRPARTPAGDLACLLGCSDGARVMMFGDQGSVWTVEGGSHPLTRRGATSAPLLELADGEVPRGVASEH
ncbi:MAG: DNA gyrase C-terminal beta-propeller domain-containing protein, partial [Acidimicrobiales bacterium]